MSVDSAWTLDERIRSKLDELIEINIESYNGLRRAARRTSSISLARVLNELAHQRRSQAMELQEFLSGDECQTTVNGVRDPIRRRILDWSDALADHPEIMRKRVTRGEGYLKAKYEAAIVQIGNNRVADILQRHHAAIIRAEARLNAMAEDETPNGTVRV